jgi:autotransporter-associated beta strand protein
MNQRSVAVSNRSIARLGNSRVLQSSKSGLARTRLFLAAAGAIGAMSLAASQARAQISIVDGNFSASNSGNNGDVPGWSNLSGYDAIFQPNTPGQGTFSGALDPGDNYLLALNQANCYQQFAGTMVAGTTYSVTVAYGWRNDIPQYEAQDFSFILRTNIFHQGAYVASDSPDYQAKTAQGVTGFGDPAGAVSTTAPYPSGPGVLEHDTLTYTATAADQGQPLTFQMYVVDLQLVVNDITITQQTNALPNQLFFSGAVSGAWDSTAADNFTDSTGATQPFINATDSVAFNDTSISGNAISNTSIVIQNGGVQPTSVIVGTSIVNYTFSDADGTHGITGPATLVKSGTSTLILDGSNSYTGGTNISNGTIQLGVNGALGTGQVLFNGTATLQAGANVTLTNPINAVVGAQVYLDANGNTFNVSGGISNAGATAYPVVRPMGAGTVNISGPLSILGVNNNGDEAAIFLADKNNNNTTNITATGTVTGISSGWLGSSNTLNLAPAGTLTITNTTDSIDEGQQGGNGVINQTAGTINAAGNLILGKWDSSYGSFTQTGGTLNVAGIQNGGQGNFNGNTVTQQAGGTLNASGSVVIGYGGSGTNIYYQTTGTTTVGGNFYIANGGGSTGVATVSGGTLSVAGQFALGQGGANTTAILNLNGGVTTAGGIVSGSLSSTGIVNFNGGTLVAAPGTSPVISGVTATVGSGGAIFNTAGQSITVTSNLLTTANTSGLYTTVGNTVSVSGGSGYIGAPAISITSNDGNGSGASAVAVVNPSTGQVTGVTITNPGTGYTSAPNFNFYGGLGIGGTVASASMNAVTNPNATDGGVTKLGTGTLTLSGSNTYLGGTRVQGGTLVVGNASALSTGSVALSNSTTLGFAKVPSQVISLSGFNYDSNFANNFAPVVSSDGTSVQMTSAQNSEATSIFSPGTYSISDATGFSASFTYSHANIGVQGSAADGVTFTIQSAAGTALGLPGGQLGYGGGIPNSGGIVNSLAAGIDLYNNQLETGINGSFNSPAGVTNSLNGASATNPSGAGTVPISLVGNWQVNISYTYNASTGGQLTETLTNPANGSSYTYVTTGVDLSSILGGSAGGTSSGYIGFTGATGGFNDSQTISNFEFNNNSSSGTAYSAVGITNAVIVNASAATTIQLAPTAGFSSASVGPITIGSGGLLTVSIGSSPAAGVTHGVLTVPSLTFTNPASGTLNVANNALDITGESLAAVTALAKTGYANGAWTGPGLSSSAAAADSRHLTALGVIQNNQNGTALYGTSNTFEGITPGASDILVKYTYYGDTNLDGTVDGSDYSRIDNAYTYNQSHSTTPLTGWFNGDFNYDGSVNGSDYTLIDNAFNSQGVAFSAQVATATAQVAGSAVPEPASLGLLAIGAAGLLGRRRRSN